MCREHPEVAQTCAQESAVSTDQACWSPAGGSAGRGQKASPQRAATDKNQVSRPFPEGSPTNLQSGGFSFILLVPPWSSRQQQF